MNDPGRYPRGTGKPAEPQPERSEIDNLLRAVARGDDAAFTRLYDLLAPRVFGLARRVLRDPAQAEEMAQEVLVEVWRTASRFDAQRGSGLSWVLTIAHRRTVDRVRSEQAASDRLQKVAAASVHVPYDEVADQVGTPAGAPAGPPLPRRSHRAAAAGDHPRLLRRSHLPRGGDAARRRPAHRQDPDAGRSDPPAGLPERRGDPMTSPDIHALGGAYALDAVDDLERVAFDRHLAECEACTVEVAEYRETATRLAEGSWSVPPPRMREQVLARAAATPQLPPNGHRRGVASPVARWRRLAAAAAVVGVLGIGAAATTYTVQEQRLDDQRTAVALAQQQADRIQAVLAAPDAALRGGRPHRRRPGDRRRVRHAGRRRRRAGRRTATGAGPGLPALARPRRAASPRSPPVLLPAGQAQATELIEGVRGRAVFAVSLEPAGGSPAPSTTPLVGISLV